jgi:uncharacterized protein
VTNLIIAFATGLTAGGLSCLAVQGGMLASSLSHHTEAKIGEAPRRSSARPILLFLGAKLIAYTILGFVLGWFGQLLQLTPTMRAVLQIAIGLFMLGTALRLLNVHPIFRHFVIEPPKVVTRYIRRKTKYADDNWLAPVFLGALTVLIPCGVTQAMMALAVTTGSPIAGAGILFAFVLGTTPLFFGLAYMATKLGTKWQSKFWKTTGVVVMALGLLSVDSSLNLLGSPVSLSTIQSQPLAKQTMSTPSAAAGVNNNLTMTITDQAYTPAVMEARAGLPIRLTAKTNHVRGCARSLVIPSLNVQKLLGETDTQEIVLPPQVAGTIRLTCSMGMYGAQIAVK